MPIKMVKLGAIAASILSISAIVSTPAHAMSLFGDLDFEGGGVRVTKGSGGMFSFDFLQRNSRSDVGTAGDARVSDASSGSFAEFSGQGIKIQDFSTNPNSPFLPVQNFITGLMTASGEQVSFTLTDATGFTNSVLGTNRTISGATLNGFFVNPSGDTAADGLFTVPFRNSRGTGTSNFAGTLGTGAEPVPTPALLPGLIGVGAATLRKRKTAAAVANKA